MKTFPFLRLPAEIRDQIYGYLLSTKHTKHYPAEEDPEWEDNNLDMYNRYKLMRRPAHVYRFHVGILGANRQINREASHVLYDRNMLVDVQSNLAEWDIDFDRLGVPLIAENERALGFPPAVLKIEIEAGWVPWPGAPTLHIIIAGADLPAFCTALVLGGRLPDLLDRSSLTVSLNCNPKSEEIPNTVSFPSPQVKSLLETFRLLHSFPSCDITGPIDEQYRSGLCLSICRKAPSFQESLSVVENKVKEGDEAVNAQAITARYRQAIKIYTSAMVELKDRCHKLDHDVLSWTVHSTADMNLHDAYLFLIFRLQVSLANAHIQSGQYEQSYKWSDRAVRAAHKTGFGQTSFYEDHPHYLKAFVLHARSNNKLGRWDEAVESMKIAVRIAPHLEQELKFFEEDKERHKAKQLNTVRVVLERSRNRNGSFHVIRYPTDFERVEDQIQHRHTRY